MNQREVMELIRDVKEKYPSKTIWLYTGYLWEEICTLEQIRFIDVVVDGRFVLEEKDNTLHWKGSKNQRVIDVAKSLESGSVVLHTRL